LMAGVTRDLVNRGLRAEHLYVSGYLAIVAVWPWQGERFLYGVLPFLFVYFLNGIRVVVSRLDPLVTPRVTARMTALAFVVLVALQLVRSLMIQDFLDHLPNLKAGMEWIARNTPAEAIIMAEQPQSVFLYSGRKTVPMATVDAPKGIRERHPDYVVIAAALEWRADGELAYSETTAAVLEELEAGAVPAKLVFRDEPSRVSVYKLLPRRGSP